MKKKYLLAVKLYFISVSAQELLSNPMSNHKKNFLDMDLNFRCQSFQAEYVKNKYEIQIEGLDCIYYPAKKAERLIIVFSYFHKNVYALWSWFWQMNEDWDKTAYLFIKDDDLNWYVGTESCCTIPLFLRIINYFIEKTGVQKNNVFTIGLSMGGYGAILYAALLGLKGAIADVPQVDLDSWKREYSAIKPDVCFIDLVELLKEMPHIPSICLHYGNYPTDLSAANKLIDFLQTRSTFFLSNKQTFTIHSGSITKAIVEAEIDYMHKI